jgi:hypothetical protein
MAENGEKRSPTAHRTPSQTKRHGRTYHATTTQKKRRAARNKARRQAIREGRASKGDGKDVHHVKPLSKGGSTKKSNTRVISASKNRAHGMTKGKKPNMNKGRKKGKS